MRPRPHLTLPAALSAGALALGVLAIGQASIGAGSAAGASATQTFFSSTARPAVALDADTNAVELGMRVSFARAGSVTALRFYKGGYANGGTHVGHLWSSGGTLLRTQTFAAETTSGWQQVTLATPLSVSAGQTVVVSYYAPRGRYSATSDYFTGTRTNGDLTTRLGAGVYRYGTTGGAPTQVYRNSNYFVDLVYAPTTTTTSPTPTTTTTSPTPTTTTTSPTPTTTTTSPTPTTTTTAPAAATAWQRGLAWYQANTGVPAGTTLTPSGSVTVTRDGTVVENLDVNGTITISARNVTVRNSRVRGQIINTLGDPNQGILIDHVEVDVSALPIGASQKYAVNSFWGTTVRFLKAHGMSQGVAFSGYVTVEDSYFYNLRSSGTHSEAILSNGDNSADGGNAAIRRNWMDAENSAAGAYVSGALCMYGDFGQIRNVVVDGNYLTGAGYLLYPGAVSGKPYPLPYNVTVTNNVFDPKGWGAVYPSSLDATSTSHWSNNTLVSGAAVPAPTGNA